MNLLPTTNIEKELEKIEKYQQGHSTTNANEFLLMLQAIPEDAKVRTCAKIPSDTFAEDVFMEEEDSFWAQRTATRYHNEQYNKVDAVITPQEAYAIAEKYLSQEIKMTTKAALLQKENTSNIKHKFVGEIKTKALLTPSWQFIAKYKTEK